MGEYEGSKWESFSLIPMKTFHFEKVNCDSIR